MNNFKVEYLEGIKFVDWDNYEKSEMKDDCIKYIKDLQQRIDKANEEIQKLIDTSNDTIINPMWNYSDVIRKLEIIQDELVGGGDKE